MSICYAYSKEAQSWIPINTYITNLESYAKKSELDNKLNKKTEPANKGKALIVDSQGDIIPTILPKDYNALENLPKIEGTVLKGNISKATLNIKDGKTPQKGIDYFTPQEKEELLQGYAKTASLPTKISQLANDSKFIKLEEVPKKLPNPNALTIRGAVSGSYDGSSGTTINIPTDAQSVNNLKFKVLTKQEFQGLGSKDPNTIYLVK